MPACHLSSGLITFVSRCLSSFISLRRDETICVSLRPPGNNPVDNSDTGSYTHGRTHTAAQTQGWKLNTKWNNIKIIFFCWFILNPAVKGSSGRNMFDILPIKRAVFFISLEAICSINSQKPASFVFRYSVGKNFICAKPLPDPPHWHNFIS